MCKVKMEHDATVNLLCSCHLVKSCIDNLAKLENPMIVMPGWSMPICLARKFKAKIFFFLCWKICFFLLELQVKKPGQRSSNKVSNSDLDPFSGRFFFHFLSQPIFPGRLLSQGLEELIAASRISAAASGCSWRDTELCNTRNCSLT